MINSNIRYKGSVGIELQRGSIRAHNNGTRNLFNIINRIFTNKLFDKDGIIENLPSYISFIPESRFDTDITDYTSYTEKILINELTIASREITADERIVYKSLLTRNMINSSYAGLLNNETPVVALLLDGSCKNILAYSIIDSVALKSICENEISQATVEWELHFDNQLYEEE